VLANARRCRPAPLERQQDHHEDENEAAHRSGESINPSVQGFGGRDGSSS
jgi:hypothetical protein